MSQDLTSLKDITHLPDLQQFYAICQSLALLDAILCPEWEYRYFSFNKNWSDNHSMASLRDGTGNHYFILLDNAYRFAIGKIYDDSLANSDIKFDFTNEALTYFISEPAFINDETSLYFYRFENDKQWHITPSIEDIPFLGFIAHTQKAYIPWAIDYYEIDQDINNQVINDIFNHKALTQEMLNQLNPSLVVTDLVEDTHEIGYPVKFD